MPAVKKLEPVKLFTKRDLIISALAVYVVEMQGYRTKNQINLPGSDKQKLRSELFELKSKFFQGYNVDYKNVIDNSILLILDNIEEKLDFSEKDISRLINIYNDYIDLLMKSENQPIKLWYPSSETDVLGYSFGIKLKNSSEIKPRKSIQWLYKGFAYEVQGHYSEDETRLLILEDFDKERRMFEKLRAKFDDVVSDDLNYERSRIPEKVRIEVWRRDSGKCARCGSREKLEYDHIVPISKGGSNTARNIELLCEKCNRSKSNNIV